MSEKVCGICKDPIKGLFRDHSDETCISTLSLRLAQAEAESERLRGALRKSKDGIEDMINSGEILQEPLMAELFSDIDKILAEGERGEG